MGKACFAIKSSWGNLQAEIGLHGNVADKVIRLPIDQHVLAEVDYDHHTDMDAMEKGSKELKSHFPSEVIPLHGGACHPSCAGVFDGICMSKAIVKGFIESYGQVPEEILDHPQFLDEVYALFPDIEGNTLTDASEAAAKKWVHQQNYVPNTTYEYMDPQDTKTLIEKLDQEFVEQAEPYYFQ